MQGGGRILSRALIQTRLETETMSRMLGLCLVFVCVPPTAAAAAQGGVGGPPPGPSAGGLPPLSPSRRGAREWMGGLGAVPPTDEPGDR